MQHHFALFCCLAAVAIAINACLFPADGKRNEQRKHVTNGLIETCNPMRFKGDLAEFRWMVCRRQGSRVCQETDPWTSVSD